MEAGRPVAHGHQTTKLKTVTTFCYMSSKTLKGLEHFTLIRLNALVFMKLRSAMKEGGRRKLSLSATPPTILAADGDFPGFEA